MNCKKPLVEQELRKVRKMLKKFKNVKMMITDSTIAKACASYGFECVCREGLVEVKNGRHKWKLQHDGYKVNKVWHYNYGSFLSKDDEIVKDSWHQGYHEQRCKRNKLMDVLEYIKCHDLHFYDDITDILYMPAAV